jgi:putative endonuclease
MVTNKSNHVLYIGVTDELAKRIYEHQEGMIPGFTQQYRTSKLIYYEVFPDPHSAIAREEQLKGWRPEKKANLIAKLNPHWNDLYPEVVGLEEKLVKV